MGKLPNVASALDRRVSERIATALRGKVFPGGVDCTIRDMSRAGARLRFAGDLPTEEPSVVVVWTTGYAFEITRRWRAGDEIGVQVRKRHDLRSPVAPHLADIKAEWLGRRSQLRRHKIKGCDAIVGRSAPPSVVRIS